MSRCLAPVFASTLAELELVPEGIRRLEAPRSRDPFVVGNWYAGGRELRRQRIEICRDEARVRLPRGRKGVLDADVQLLGAGTEPATAIVCERRRLRDLGQPEQARIERPGLRLTPGRRRHLHMVDSGDRHLLRSTIARVSAAPPRLEDTLVTGYARLASDSPNRRIDLELRTLDIAFATFFLILLSPVALVIAAIMLVTSGRPVLYRGQRVGRRGRFFEMLKFRTLKHGAEERIGQYLGAELVRQTDAEFTHIGRWLKASQLDEIPQLWNVLRGDMSFVGPRPIRPRFFTELAHDLPAYWQRLVVPPGLTGFAQVRRGYETSMAEKLAHDLEWIADRSVRLYLRTLLVTGVRVLRQSLRRHT